MKLALFNLSQPADVHWENPSTDLVERHFQSVTNAVRFVMEDLTDFPQSTAWIGTGAGKLSFDEIAVLYSRQKTGFQLLD